MPLGPPSPDGLGHAGKHVRQATVVGVGRSAPDGIASERTGARLIVNAPFAVTNVGRKAS